MTAPALSVSERREFLSARTLTRADLSVARDGQMVVLDDREVTAVRADQLVPGDLLVLSWADGRAERLAAVFDADLLERNVAGEIVRGIWTAETDKERGVPGRLVFRAAELLTVARRLPEVDAADLDAVAALLPAVPLLCGPAGGQWRGGAAAGGHDWDLNVRWTCARAQTLYTATGLVEDVTRQVAEIVKYERKVGRLRARDAVGDERAAERAQRRAVNLRTWVRRALVRHGALVGRLLVELPECGHAPADRRALSVADALPPCSC